MAQSGRLPGLPKDGLAGVTAGQTVAFDVNGIGRWDSGLIEFLWDAKRAAAERRAHRRRRLPARHPRASCWACCRTARPNRTAPPPRLSTRWPARRQDAIGMLTKPACSARCWATPHAAASWRWSARARMRPVDLLANISDAGPSALVIVSVVNFLVGAILAFVGAVQLRKFAADIYVANLVGLAVVREMAAVMTAIIMAGRTGGAYAARIATMQGNEEIDALTVVGIPVIGLHPAAGDPGAGLHHAAALSVWLPGRHAGRLRCLDLDADHHRHRAIVQQTLDAVPLDQFVFGFVKTIAFAILIAVTSCRIGLKAGRSAADVGIAATRAVVTGIVGVIALDARVRRPRRRDRHLTDGRSPPADTRRERRCWRCAASPWRSVPRSSSTTCPSTSGAAASSR